MNKKFLALFFSSLLVITALTACAEQQTSKQVSTEDHKSSENKQTYQTITYLGKKYKVPAKVDKIVTASQEAMEDAAVLGVKPDGAIATAGEYPQYLGDSMSKAIPIGDKMQPSTETLLKIKPDVILGTSKFQPNVVKSLNSVAPMIPISHISTNWKANLLVLAKLTGKTKKAKSFIKQYDTEVAAVKKQLEGKLDGKTVLIIRIRGGNIFIYSKDIYFNPVLYSDLGLEVPAEVQAATSQEMISLEKLAQMNPDYLFVQFDKAENSAKPEALKDFQKNSLWKSMKAVKSGKVYINSVDPLEAGGTALSKTDFIKVLKQTLAQ
ncbi:iron-uptake system-binding protein [Heyndrickxia ginsengihumi]|uniref:Iron-uptake system-binding protein n=1 Tax=Heyndrickxia ginsengihumi TaxID=363870 RepID=A0A0A6XZ25_9BACI|nr:ABC transporter substrate-binding protein [Heyndrickxia ginsengihumi]KHD85357.1 iron-uptake system-binding protein [Heyndrickxia ginsengihumi]